MWMCGGGDKGVIVKEVVDLVMVVMEVADVVDVVED